MGVSADISKANDFDVVRPKGSYLDARIAVVVKSQATSLMDLPRRVDACVANHNLNVVGLEDHALFGAVEVCAQEVHNDVWSLYSLLTLDCCDVVIGHQLADSIIVQKPLHNDVNHEYFFLIAFAILVCRSVFILSSNLAFTMLSLPLLALAT